ncbi:unnamed protein product, partial [Ectocarpus sp. 12 AP-2014]
DILQLLLQLLNNAPGLSYALPGLTQLPLRLHQRPLRRVKNGFLLRPVCGCRFTGLVECCLGRLTSPRLHCNHHPHRRFLSLLGGFAVSGAGCLVLRRRSLLLGAEAGHNACRRRQPPTPEVGDLPLARSA